MLIRVLDGLVFGFQRLQDYINLAFQHWVDNGEFRARVYRSLIVFGILYAFVMPSYVVPTLFSALRWSISFLFGLVSAALQLLVGSVISLAGIVVRSPYALLHFLFVDLPAGVGAIGQAIVTIAQWLVLIVLRSVVVILSGGINVS